MRGWKTIVLLLISNVFMTLAWYGHRKFRQYEWGRSRGLFAIILVSWGMAFFEYLFQVPANRMGFEGNGGPFSLVQLKTLQEAITLTIFMVFSIVFFKDQRLAWNHVLGFVMIVAAVYVVFRKW